MRRKEFRQEPWSRRAAARRSLFLLLIVVPTFITSGYMAGILPHKGSTPLELAIVIVFAALFAWISIGFWTALLGFYTLVRRVDRFAITQSELDEPLPLKPRARTAILIPICNENVAEVFARIRATYDSLKATGQLEHFAFFVLSDSADPDHWVEEEAAWALFRQQTGFTDIHYRRRRNNIKRKSGNVADFCRRWGGAFRYMIVFDADSIMTGPTMVRMVQIMERRSDVGILQTAPLCVNRETLLARVQQFANRLYGPMFAAGLHFWQLGDAQFWGHNAIIRIEPFMQHCGLPRLPGKPPLGGDILSHDFVEAALMRRAGYGVWLAFDLGGSYEEVPPTLLDELKRDRRWCQGNMQHMRLLFTRGLFPAHRALFLNGAMAYVSALLWFLFLSLSTAEALVEALRTPSYFGPERSLFPTWPVWYPQWALTLLVSTAVILFLPKLFSIVLVALQNRSREFGGLLRLVASVLAEVVVSTLLAPIRMLFHSKFVFITLLGGQIGWGSQNRSDEATTWGDAWRFHGGGSLLALAWGALVYLVNPSFFWWLSPILTALVLAVPVSVLTSQLWLGRAARRLGLFLTPEETDPPAELRALHTYLEQAAASDDSPLASQPGFVRAVVDPRIHRLHLSQIGGPRRLKDEVRLRRQELLDQALQEGPQALSDRDKRELLSDPASLRALHLAVWQLPAGKAAQRWGLPQLSSTA